MIKVKAQLDKNLKKKFKDLSKESQSLLDEEVLKDSNKYIPFDKGNLRDSSIRSSDIGSGILRWDTPYARRLYYNPQYNFSKDTNPLAQGLWFEQAKSVSLKEWVKKLEELARQKI